MNLWLAPVRLARLMNRELVCLFNVLFSLLHFINFNFFNIIVKENYLFLHKKYNTEFCSGYLLVHMSRGQITSLWTQIGKTVILKDVMLHYFKFYWNLCIVPEGHSIVFKDLLVSQSTTRILPFATDSKECIKTTSALEFIHCNCFN